MIGANNQSVRLREKEILHQEIVEFAKINFLVAIRCIFWGLDVSFFLKFLPFFQIGFIVETNSFILKIWV